MDLGLLNSSIGTMIMTATIVDDLINWTLFAIILSDIMPSGQAASSIPMSIALVAFLFVLILGIGRWVGPRALHWFKAHVTWPSGFIALSHSSFCWLAVLQKGWASMRFWALS